MNVPRPRLFDEDDALVSAYEQFNETGYHGTSVADLSSATGLSKGSLYGAFGDKRALFERVLDDYCCAAEDSFSALLEGAEDQALDRLRAWLRPPDSIDRRGCLLARSTAELAWESEAVASRSLAAYRRLMDGCRRLVEQAQRAGQVDPDADSCALGGMLTATQRGLEALAKSGVDAAALIQIADAAVDSICLTSRPSTTTSTS